MRCGIAGSKTLLVPRPKCQVFLVGAGSGIGVAHSRECRVYKVRSFLLQLRRDRGQVEGKIGLNFDTYIAKIFICKI